MSRQLTIYLPNLAGGGIERLYLNLAPFWKSAGLDVRFLVNEPRGELLGEAQAGFVVDSLEAPRSRHSLAALRRHLAHMPRGIIMACTPHTIATLMLARVGAAKRHWMLASHHNSLEGSSAKDRSLPWLHHLFMRWPDHHICVSQGVAEELSHFSGRVPIRMIHNGVIMPNFDSLCAAEPDHDWFVRGQKVPVLVAAGRLVAQKNFGNLLAAFQLVRQTKNARLIILGEGPQREELQAKARALGVSDHVDFRGFVANPLAFMKRARLFVCSSDYEGFANVVAEALRCGTPVVSTDCPHGPSEILLGGKHGALVPVGNATALASAIITSLAAPLSKAQLMARGKDFEAAVCANHYEQVFEQGFAALARR
jgi:glycosyltransferase involved in cell wall biosynthesis